MKRFIIFVIPLTLLLSSCAKKKLKSPFVIKTFVSYVYYFMALRDGSDESSLNRMEKTLVSIDLSQISNPEGRELFQETREKLLRLREVNSYESGFKKAEASHEIGRIMNFYCIGEDDVSFYNDPDLVKFMNALRSLMQLTDRWKNCEE